ncbi:hypothetical protein BBR01nite_61860 [Brevibacillus brevis]|nr:hypothetical protein BBR01nite_61860 [Brevibacillus brevis]
MGVSAEGVAFGWGGNTFGQIGDGTKSGKITPIQVKKSAAALGNQQMTPEFIRGHFLLGL